MCRACGVLTAKIFSGIRVFLAPVNRGSGVPVGCQHGNARPAVPAGSNPCDFKMVHSGPVDDDVLGSA